MPTWRAGRDLGGLTSEIDGDAVLLPVAVAGGGEAARIGFALGRSGLGGRLSGPVGGLDEAVRAFGGALSHASDMGALAPDCNRL